MENSMIAKDVMTPNVITVNQNTSVTTIAKLLLERHISAVPVIDQAGTMVGVVSEGDLIRRPEEGTEPPKSWWLELISVPEDAARAYAKSHGQTAADVMTRSVISVKEDTPVAEIASLLEKNRIKRVPVVRDGRPIGIVSRANLIQALAARSTAAPAVSADDRTIRENILAVLDNESWVGASNLNIVVENGTATVWGITQTEDVRDAINVAVENVPGVKSVQNHVGLMPRRSSGFA
jgi:CBS domain-containing protein